MIKALVIGALMGVAGIFALLWWAFNTEPGAIIRPGEL